VIGVTRNPNAERKRQLELRWLRGLEALPELFQQADFAVVAVPLNDQTRGLIETRELEALGRKGYLVNVSRGPVVEEEALYRALATGAIAGAGLDVWYRYPTNANELLLPASQPFWELDNVLMTPQSLGLRSQRSSDAGVSLSSSCDD